jgi:hypothetical protein
MSDRAESMYSVGRRGNILAQTLVIFLQVYSLRSILIVCTAYMHDIHCVILNGILKSDAYIVEYRGLYSAK